MKINKLLLLSAFLVSPVFAADGGATGTEGAKPPYGHHGAMQEACKADPEKCRQARMAHREQLCAQNPQKCKELKAQMTQRHEACKADPEKCRKERLAHREKMCAENPQRCKEMQARRTQRHEACKADPEKCHQERKARHGAKSQDKM